ncbi:MAG: hypothetical protein M1836_001112 [Candelina mexicana]|nr:MAG: hypothetical protein M1836_001112 [Candelina mexicana]
MPTSDFLAAFVDFTPDPTAALADEFERLAVHNGWDRTDDEYRENRGRFYASEFDEHWGTDATKLQNWQALCAEVKIEPVPQTITKCRKALQKVHFNLVDLVDSRRTGVEARRFPSVEALRKYTKKNKLFPKQAAKDDGFLKALLRHIFQQTRNSKRPT